MVVEYVDVMVELPSQWSRANADGININTVYIESRDRVENTAATNTVQYTIILPTLVNGTT
jgi:hypothetical protein